jgi:5-methylcytosine-specific restriction protein A
MKLIETKEELIANLETLENYLIDGDEFERTETIKLIKNGTCFVAYKVGCELRFAPSRYIGYADNSISKHKINDSKHGTITNIRIKKIFGKIAIVDSKLEKLYIEYCNSLGIYPNKTGSFGKTRKYWNLDIQKDFEANSVTAGEFPEGKIVERLHKARERNTMVVRLAKEYFKKQQGRLFCQVCGFDFEKVYGKIGKDFIEGHHTIPVSEMSHEHKTKVEDIALLCSNCHSMVHKRRPWLRMEDLKKIIK